jgi:RNA polymerase sigma-70 factor (ECF subfamily)
MLGEISDSNTNLSLLGRLRRDPADAGSWAEFVRRYSPQIYAWCRGRGAQEADAEDVTQMVLVKLLGRMGEFRYDPSRSFRAWLKTVTHHAWYDFQKAHQRPGQGSGDSVMVRLLNSVEARDELLQRLEEEYARELLEEASLWVQLRVAPSTWEAFRLTALEGLSGAEAGRRLGMRTSQVFVYKFRVQKLLQEAVSQLDRPEPAPV